MVLYFFMPIRRTINHDDRIVFTRCEGVMTDHDIQVDQRMFWTQDWVASYGEVFDMTHADVTQLGKTRSQYAAVVASDEATNLIPVAMVYANDSHKALADRYIEGRNGLSDKALCAAFPTADQALDWLTEQL